MPDTEDLFRCNDGPDCGMCERKGVRLIRSGVAICPTCDGPAATHREKRA